MKTIKQIYSILLLTLTIFVFVTSCQDTEFDLDSFSTSEYIDIQGDLDNPMVLIDTENNQKFAIAIERILSGAIQVGNTISFSAKSGADVNISELLYNRIVMHNKKLIESGDYILIKEKGKVVLVLKRNIKSEIVRLKSTSVEGDEDSKISLKPGTNEAQAVIDGFKNYDGQASLWDIWDMDSRNWGTIGQNVVDKTFNFNGHSGRVRLETSCEKFNGRCWGDGIDRAEHGYDSQHGTGYFILYNTQGRPTAVIRIYGQDGYNAMRNHIGW